MPDNTATISDAQSRWARLGPYYAMFPMPYVGKIVQEYTRPGDPVIDPFAGRFSTTAMANYMGRPSFGIEINPLGWLYGQVKLHPAQRCGDVLRRLREMQEASEAYRAEARAMGEFFSMCYCEDVRRFLLACRNLLKWKKSRVDATVMACLMVVLHHNRGKGLSNQMRQTKAMAPGYSVDWWKSHNMEEPPELDPVEFLNRRVRWRYDRGVFKCTSGQAIHGDSCEALQSTRVANWIRRHGRIKLLFTSPPYWSLVNYFRDQWIRLWMLGERPDQIERKHPFEKRFGPREEYRQLMRTVFSLCASMMRDDGVVVVRMDERSFTRDTILETLRDCFGEYQQAKANISTGRSQTALFNRNVPQPGERDVILTAAVDK